MINYRELPALFLQEAKLKITTNHLAAHQIIAQKIKLPLSTTMN